MTKTDKWGPAEWFGVNVFMADEATRLALAEDAQKKYADANRGCRHLSALTGQKKTCAKEGGICSVQLYRESEEGHVEGAGIPVAICPHRIISKSILNQISAKILGVEAQPVLVKEVPYSISLIKTLKSGKPAYAGRIDWLLVDKVNPQNFCAVETQSVYMSGKTQKHDFESVVRNNGALSMPPNYRHPDYKSSVPKRLLPQLQSKAQHLYATGRKTVVIIDEFVFENMHNVREIEIPPTFVNDPLKAEAHRLNASSVIFAIVSISDNTVTLVKMLYCSIAAASDALNAVTPMSRTDFEHIVSSAVLPMKKIPKKSKVFSLELEEI